jgi:hypothetical protein
MCSAILYTGLSNLFQPAQAEVVLGQLSTYLASWEQTHHTPSFPERYTAVAPSHVPGYGIYTQGFSYLLIVIKHTSLVNTKFVL